MFVVGGECLAGGWVWCIGFWGVGVLGWFWCGGGKVVGLLGYEVVVVLGLWG